MNYAEERLKICEKCEHYNPETKQCQDCGCYMQFKVVLPFVKCPIGKW